MAWNARQTDALTTCLTYLLTDFLSPVPFQLKSVTFQRWFLSASVTMSWPAPFHQKSECGLTFLTCRSVRTLLQALCQTQSRKWRVWYRLNFLQTPSLAASQMALVFWRSSEVWTYQRTHWSVRSLKHFNWNCWQISKYLTITLPDSTLMEIIIFGATPPITIPATATTASASCPFQSFYAIGERGARIRNRSLQPAHQPSEGQWVSLTHAHVMKSTTHLIH